MCKKIELSILILCLIVLIFVNNKIVKYTVSDNIEINKEVIVLDPGHGGEDPGKVGINGSLEKDINLAIAKKVKAILADRGYEIIMTRETDVMLGAEKKEDMKERVKVINESKAKLAVSIHQNSFTDAQVSGAQVFYYQESEEGEIAAECMQQVLLELDENNHRQKKANDNYYLLKYTEIPTIIVECGFLSNKEEAAKLVDEEYQNTLSNAIVRGIESCFMN